MAAAALTTVVAMLDDVAVDVVAGTAVAQFRALIMMGIAGPTGSKSTLTVLLAHLYAFPKQSLLLSHTKLQGEII